MSACLIQGKSDIHHPHVQPSCHLGCGNLDPKVTTHHKQWQSHWTKTPCLWDQWLSRVIHLQCRLLTQSDIYSLANWDLRVCSRNSWDTVSLPIQVPTSFLPSLLSHQKIHTHANIIFSPFDVYFNHSLQFTMLVWESVFSLLAISKKADLWRHNCKLTFSIQLLSAQLILLQGLSFFGGWAYLLFWFCLLLWLCLIFWYPFQLWFSFLHAQQQKKQFGFLVFFTFIDRVAYDRIFFLKVPFRSLLTLIVIFRALKDKRRVLVLRKGNNILVGRETSWKGIWADEGFWQARAV